jgi:hypothetical protein
MPDTDAEVVLHMLDIPVERSVNYLVDDVGEAVESMRRAGAWCLWSRSTYRSGAAPCSRILSRTRSAFSI